MIQKLRYYAKVIVQMGVYEYYTIKKQQQIPASNPWLVRSPLAVKEIQTQRNK